MTQIVVKAHINGRIRLKSPEFNPKNFEKINKILEKKVKNIRLNQYCNSLIIHFDQNIINLDEILTKLEKNFAVAGQKESQKISKKIEKSKSLTISTPACNACLHCSTNLVSESSWRKKLLNFGALSLIAVGVFVKEHIMATPLGLLAKLTIGAISIYSAIPLIKEGLEELKEKKMSLQGFIAFALLIAILGGEVTAAFEIIYILRGSMLFEEYTANKSRAEIHKLISLDVKKAYVLQGDLEVEVSLEDVKDGDIIVCRSGEKIVADGVIINGSAEINEAIINGRSESVYKKKNDSVFANTLVEKGRIYIKVSATGNETYIARIISEVEKNLLNKSQSELSADRLAQKVLKIGSALSVGTFFVTGSFLRAFSVMIVMSCPCSTVLAASSAVSAAIARAAKDGILIKGGEYLENVSQSEIFCFDKTGTLTTGKPKIVGFKLISKITKEEFFKIASSIEHHNTHPLAVSINEYAKGLNISANIHFKSEILPGLGVKAKFEDSKFLLGNLNLMRKYKVKIQNFKIPKFTSENTIIYLARDSEILGAIIYEHEIRTGSIEAVKALKERGKKVVLLTGDDEKVAKEFAKKFEFDDIYFSLMPDDKAKIIQKLKNYGKVVMIGDGVNDTLAMSKSDIGISFASGGSEAAIEISNIAITNSRPIDIVKLHDLSAFALRVVKQNYNIGTSTNMLGAALGALGVLSPAGAGLVHIAHTAGIIANSSRISIKK
ncbi:heavy metal translocating P-type ATPase [Campylobacter sp. RM16187]|uniref:heavy metal translocating P-type ATPase n=1 Tax=Campylobacter sp. RM16187 TaxID=1660063 RepID=UPI0021B67CE7|nr:cation-translocating P-type ATPase [Campylobacter sp. RM16187]QKG29113.1 heavy metal translocating P-type ATPase [Campylobacter sp. RM16187]